MSEYPLTHEELREYYFGKIMRSYGPEVRTEHLKELDEELEFLWWLATKMVIKARPDSAKVLNES